MQKITLLAVGSFKEEWAKEAAAQYAARLRRDAELEIVEVPASKEKEPVRQKADESRRLLSAAAKTGGEIWVLDETGERLTSASFAQRMSRMRDAGTHAVFLLGGAYGLTDEVRAAAHAVIRLSDMTLPHELCRVVFLEQLYRACEINRGSGYHH